MNDFYLPYANILLFSCPGCNKPLPIQVMSAARNLETIDADTCDVQCECGWTKEFLGVEAIRHWVTEWEAKITIENPSQQMAADQ
jgi:transcription elongation factor Elf1